MHGLFFILFIPMLVISIVINIIYINLKKKAIISLGKNLMFNLILFLFCIVVSVIIFSIFLSFHDEIGCDEIGAFEPGITITLIFIPIANFFYIKKHKTAHNNVQAP